MIHYDIATLLIYQDHLGIRKGLPQLVEREDVLGRAGRDSASLSPESLLPRVAVRRIDVFESGGEAKRVEKTIHEHGQWLGLLRPVGLDAVEQAVVYEDDFRRGVRRFAFVPHRSKL